MENQIETNSKKIKLDFKDAKYATGRRIKSIAKVWLKKGSGNIHVNGKKMVDYFTKQNLQIAIFRPLSSVIAAMSIRACSNEVSLRSAAVDNSFLNVPATIG